MFNPNKGIANGNISGISERNAGGRGGMGRRTWGCPELSLPILPPGCRNLLSTSHGSWLPLKTDLLFYYIWKDGMLETSTHACGAIGRKYPEPYSAERPFIFHWGSDIILWYLTSLKWGAKFPNPFLCSPHPLLLDLGLPLLTWLLMLIPFNQGLFKWDFVSYRAVIHPFRSSGPKAIGRLPLNGKVWIIIL